MTNQFCDRCSSEKSHIESFTIKFSYGSKFDMEEWGMNICDDCLVEFVGGFQSKPKGYGITGYEDYVEATNNNMV